MKRSFILLVVAFVALLTFASCSKEDASARTPQPEPPTPYSHLLTDDEASAQAREVYGALFSSELRSGRVPEIESVERLPALRSEDGTERAGICAVNFKDDQGYILMSEDKRSIPILALLALAFATCDKEPEK